MAYQLAATRASLMTSSAELIHWGTFGAALIVAIGIGVPGLRFLFGLDGPALKVAVVVLSLGLLALIAGALLGLVLLHPRYRSFLEQARAEGDRRLRHAIEERTGGFLAMGPRDATVACLGGLLITILVCQVANGQGFWILRPWWWALVGQALIPAGVVFYGLFWVSARALATQAVLGNRLEATRVAALEKKPPPAEG